MVLRSDQIPVTKEGYLQLQEEIEFLKTRERPKTLAELNAARALGDLKENAEYHAAKERLAQIDQRLGLLEQQLMRATIVELPKKNLEKVVFGAAVLIRDEEAEKDSLRIYKIVGDFEADIKKDKISITSPLGRSLINKKVNESFVLVSPKGEREYTILGIYHSLEDAYAHKEKELN